MNLNFEEAVKQILAEDARYAPEAYRFIREALDFTMQQKVSDPTEGPSHVSGQELLDGIRCYTLQEYGPMARMVLNRWGIQQCIDFGYIVFNLVNKEILGKTAEDRVEDFAHGYDFGLAFDQPFEPKNAVVPGAKTEKNPGGGDAGAEGKESSCG